MDELFLPTARPPRNDGNDVSPHPETRGQRSKWRTGNADQPRADEQHGRRRAAPRRTGAHRRAGQPHKRAGRERTAHIIDQEIDNYHAQSLNGHGAEFHEPDRGALARSLREDFVGLGAIAERMLTDPDAQEWMVNAPKRVFRDDGQRIERVPDLVFATTARSAAFLERLLEQVEGKRLDRITPRVEARLPDGSRLTAAIPPVSSTAT